MNAIYLLTQLIKMAGPIPAARVSSARARGRAANYAYWGTADYEIRLRKSDGAPIAVATSAAPSRRRSWHLAGEDCREYCKKTGKVEIITIGEVNEQTARAILRHLLA
jgi:hypothetical protein